MSAEKTDAVVLVSPTGKDRIKTANRGEINRLRSKGYTRETSK